MTECLAAVVTDYNGPLVTRKVTVPDLKPGAMIGKVEAATLCGTDVHIWHGGIPASPPYIPGHETVVTIAEMNGERRDVLGMPLGIGDRVITAYPFCGTCFYCAIANQPTLCQNSARYGRENCEEFPYLLGGCAELHYLSPHSEVVRVPDEVSGPLAASAACALRTVMHAFERLGGILPHETVLVQGCGPVGLYATAVARDRGAGKIIVVGAPAARLGIAKAWGADEVLDLDHQPDPKVRQEWVLEQTDGRGPDVVLQCAGGRAIEEGLDLVRPGGRFVSIGGGGGKLSVSGGALSAKNLQFIGIRSGQGRHYLQAITFLATRRSVPFDQLLSRTYSLDTVTDALQAMAELREVKPVVLPSISGNN